MKLGLTFVASSSVSHLSPNGAKFATDPLCFFSFYFTALSLKMGGPTHLLPTMLLLAIWSRWPIRWLPTYIFIWSLNKFVYATYSLLHVLFCCHILVHTKQRSLKLARLDRFTCICAGIPRCHLGHLNFEGKSHDTSTGFFLAENYFSPAPFWQWSQIAVCVDFVLVY